MRDRLVFIGEIHTPYESIEQCPANITQEGSPCSVVIYDDYKTEMFGLRRGQKIMLLYWLCDVTIEKKLFYGAFALRTPHRPNPIAVAVVEIVDIAENVIRVNGMDCLNGTKLLDVKPAINEERE